MTEAEKKVIEAARRWYMNEYPGNRKGLRNAVRAMIDEDREKDKELILDALVMVQDQVSELQDRIAELYQVSGCLFLADDVSNGPCKKDLIEAVKKWKEERENG